MLYDGAIRFLTQAKLAFEHQNREMAREKLMRAEDIINELNSSLDLSEGGQIAGSLRSLYLWMKRQIMQALINQDPAPLDECISQLQDLREAWAEAAGAEESAPLEA